MSSRLPGFYRLPLAARRTQVAEVADIAPDDWAAIEHGGIDAATADHMIENVLGTYALPFAVALNFTIDGGDLLVPMAVEEASVVAAASNAARMVRAGGGFTAKVSAPIVIGQIQVTHVADADAGAAAVVAARDALLHEARALVPRLVARGGGPVELSARVLARSGPDGGVLVAHLHVDCCDAMGANLVNGLCEDLADRVASLARGKVGLRILSNLVDGRTVTITARAPDAALAADGADGPAVRRAIAAASRFAELDPYRACTHNKGIMNGVDAVLVATGQDWRAVEAGAHAFASHTGVYRPLATWREDEAAAGLVGELHMPLAVGTVGGALHVHPGARLALRLARASSAQKLAAVAGAAGLATNLAALRALATDGIQRGHMALHARVVARAVGATGEQVDAIAAELAASGEVKAEAARVILARLTGESPP